MNYEKQSIRNLIFNPMLYVEYPYHWSEKKENGNIEFIFSKTPRFTLAQEIEIINKIRKLKESDK